MFVNILCELLELNINLTSMECGLSVSDLYVEIDQWIADLRRSSTILIQTVKLRREEQCGFATLNHLCSVKLK